MNPRTEIINLCNARVQTIEEMTLNHTAMTVEEQQSASRLVTNAWRWDCDSAAQALSSAIAANVALRQLPTIEL